MASEPPSPKLHLENRTKINVSESIASSRVLSTEDTLKKILPISEKIGVTRISDITFMDRLYMPNYSATLPGTEDTFWVYSGKGMTRANAKASALMEAIERYSSFPTSSARCLIQGSYSDLSKSYDKVLHPDEVVEPTDQEYDDNTVMEFMLGYDLLTDESVLVPAAIALYRYYPKPPAINIFSCCHTNGLASGNVIEEAICHALCEVIERDAVSIADLSASSIPYSILESMVSLLKLGKHKYLAEHFKDKFADDSSIFQDVNISNLSAQFRSIRYVVEKFSKSGISLLIKNITQDDIGIPTFLASSVEWLTQDYGYLAKGFGTHPDARIALIRAITEVSQTRAVNIHGARDDLKKIEYKVNDEIYKRKWQFTPATDSLSKSSSKNKNTIQFSEIRTYVNKDILYDIKLILSRLRKAGLKRAIIVNLTNPKIGVPVVRAIVPGLETFEVTNSLMGSRAKEYFRMLHKEGDKKYYDSRTKLN